MAQSVKQKQAAKRRSLAAKTHQQASKERAQDVSDKRVAHLAAKDDPAMQDVLKTAQSFINMHLKLAQDGVGARPTGHKLVDGTEEVEHIYMTNDQRAGHLDKAAGIQELLDYIERQQQPVSDKLAKTATGK